MAVTQAEHIARLAIIRAFRALTQYGPGTVGHRDAVQRLLPNAIEAMVEAKLDARLAQLDPVKAANDEIVDQMKSTQS
jgi:hypothetical protein